MVKEWTHSLLNQGIPQGFSQGSQDNVIIPQFFGVSFINYAKGF